MKHDVIVIGVGSMGAATCYHLARRGLKVLGLEQFDIPHERGSHHGESRMIRLAYFEHPDYVPLLQRSYELWDKLESETGQKLLYITGGLYMGPHESELVAGAMESCRQHNLAHEMLDRSQINERFGQLRLPDNYSALYEERAGFLLPQAAVAAHAEQARKFGAALHDQEPVVHWNADSSGVTVTTQQATYQAGHVVLTGGAWSGQLLQSLGLDLKVTRQVLAWFEPPQPDLFALGKFPVWFLETPDGCGNGHYGFPIAPHGDGVKVALHAPGSATDPATVSREITNADVDALQGFLRQYIPDAAGDLLTACVCYYTYSPDSHFIVDRHPEQSRVTFACGFSGHGFKFSTVMGEVLADLATNGETQRPIEFLRLARLA